MPGPLLLVDTPFFLFRAWFALPDSIKGKDGKPVNALLGATNAILDIVRRYEPRAVVCCFGAEAAPYRVELYDGYHADRDEEPPPGLDYQFAVAPQLFSGFGWEIAFDRNLEADDLLGSYAALEQGAGGRALIFTGDRDMFQCAGERVTVLWAKRGSEPLEFGPEEVLRHYGVPPGLVPDFIALRGDPSDGIPGAPGVGPKTAADMLKRHGSLEALLGEVDEERPKVAGTLRDHADALLRYKKIATLQP
jgi:5'-3' exonuclease